MDEIADANNPFYTQIQNDLNTEEKQTTHVFWEQGLYSYR